MMVRNDALVFLYHIKQMTMGIVNRNVIDYDEIPKDLLEHEDVILDRRDATKRLRFC
jgi:cobalamin-dependent methionine synthase I